MERKYRKPPIAEVVCEFRFIPGNPWDLTVPGLLYEKLQGQFPKRQLVKKAESRDVAEANGIRKEISLETWARFLRNDEKAFTQVGPDLLSVNHLEPYPTWEGFEPLIRQCFDAYKAAASPRGIRRIGLRYVNRVEISYPEIEKKDYLQFYPYVGPDLPQQFEAFIAGIQVPFEGDRDTLRLQLTSAELQTQGNVAFLLDLDYFLSKPEAVDFQGVFDWVRVAHEHILTVFEACLTDRLREQFEPEEV
jgi:uncharacterized protein (TIGR04255 family)